MRIFRIVLGSFLVFFSFLFLIPTSQARYTNNSSIYMRPALDGSRYLLTEQSQGLYQWGYNFGLNVNYAFESLELASSSNSSRVSGVINDLLVGNFTGSVGLTDWLNVGFDMPVAFYETFYNFINPTSPGNPQCTPTATCPKQTKTKMGDLLFAAKFRILDSDRYPVGLSLQPFVLFPTGDGFYTTGYGQLSGGGKLIFDANINRRVYFALNAGYQILKNKNYAPDTAFATIDDQILYSGAVSVPVGKNFLTFVEGYGVTLAKSPFKHQIQSPVEALGGLRYSPGTIKNWSFALAGGAGLDKGFGAAAWRAWGQVTYRKSKVLELETEKPVSVEAPYEEKIVITQKIHFEFDRSVIRPISFPILDDVVEVLKRNPQIKKIRVEGHTDFIGSDAYNMKLSQHRAESVKNYLIQKGIEADRLIAAGYGKSRPIADNNTAEGRAKNRRTEFTAVE